MFFLRFSFEFFKIDFRVVKKQNLLNIFNPSIAYLLVHGSKKKSLSFTAVK